MEEEEQPQRLTRQGVAAQSSESHMVHEWQEAYLKEEGQYADSQRSRVISGGKRREGCVYTFFVV